MYVIGKSALLILIIINYKISEHEIKQIRKTAMLGTVQILRKANGKGKAVPLQAWGGPVGSRKLMLPDFMTTAQDGGKVISLRHRPPLPPGNTPGTHFC
jgi:hypothetical protein